MIEMNAEIIAFVAPFLPKQPDGLTMEDKDGWAAWQATYRDAWLAAHRMPETDAIRVKHGLVRCEDATGWRYA